MRFLLLGASGSVGRRILAQGLKRGHAITAQTRDAGKLAGLPAEVTVVSGDPRDGKLLRAWVAGQDAVMFSIGAPPARTTTLFSDVTRALIDAMAAGGVRRLVAITGVGAGETRGHGGFLYDRLIYPVFTRPFYVDKDRQEALIRASTLDWVIVRPAPFSDAPAAGPLHKVTTLTPDTVLNRITRDEVATFVLDQLDSDAYLRRAVFIGHGRAGTLSS